jgi:hypothetical protein
LNQEFRPYYTLIANHRIWHDYAVIKLNHVYESLNKIGLVKRFDATLRLWINTGTFNINVANPNATNCSYNLVPSNNTFSNTCPMNLAEQLTGSDFEVSTGLMHQGYWETSKWYCVNVERGNIADKLQPRKIKISFNNNSNVAIDI